MAQFLMKSGGTPKEQARRRTEASFLLTNSKRNLNLIVQTISILWLKMAGKEETLIVLKSMKLCKETNKSFIVIKKI